MRTETLNECAPIDPMSPIFSEGAFERVDEGEDGIFYETDRFVSHLDRVALDTVQNLIGELIDQSGGQPSPMFIRRPTYLMDHRAPRIQTTPFYSAYLKIAEGCSHRCAYCTIPSLRGSFRSRPLDSLLAEANEMAARGVKEINLIAQDSTMYGRDLKGNVGMEDLLEGLVTISGIRWIRVLYGHPHRVTERFLDLVESEETLCPYLDIPLQHVHEGILKAMGRYSEMESPRQLLERIRSRAVPISLRTTVMVGFPGETDEIFQELFHFVQWAEFDHLGAFVYSPEMGTPAAKFKDQVDSRVAEQRRKAVMTLQARVSERKNRRMVGKTVPVLLEGFSDETDLLLRGRTATMAPDVDGQVLIAGGQGKVGEILPVRITEAHPYDLVGELVE